MNNKQMPLLMGAIDKSDVLEIENLLNTFADLIIIDKNVKIETPLHRAVTIGNADVVRLFLAKGAYNEAKNADNKTPFELCSHLDDQQKQAIEAVFNDYFKNTFIKRPGTAAVGQFYETKLLTMVLFRLLQDGQIEDFYLGNNLDDAGAFDDVVFRTFDGGKSRVCCVQTKHKKPDHTINFRDLINTKDTSGDFHLSKYYESYLKIRYMFGPTSKSLIFQGEYDASELELIIFTPAKLNLPNASNCTNSTELNTLHTKESGKIVQIKYTEALKESFRAWHKNVVAEMLARLLLLQNCDTKNLKNGIKTLKYENNNNYNSSDLLQLFSNEKVMEVSSRKAKTLGLEVSKILEDPFIPTDEELEQLSNDFLEKLRFYLEQATEDNLEEIVRRNIKATKKYDNDELIYSKSYAAVERWWKQSGHVRFLDKNCAYFEMTANEVELEKLHYIGMDKIRNNFVQFDIEEAKKSTWANFYQRNLKGNSFCMNVFTSTPKISSLKLVQYFRDQGTEYKYVFIRETEIEQIVKVLATIKPKCLILAYLSETDAKAIGKIRQNIDKLIIITKKQCCSDCSSIADETILCDLEHECQKNLLERDVLFQGNLVPLETLMNEAPITLLDAVTLEKLINGERLVISTASSFDKNDNSLRFYIDRVLLDAKQQTFEPMKIRDKVALVVAAPGMGKSTLLTWLAAQMKNDNLASWIVRINLLDCSAQFDQWNKNNTTLRNEQVLNFLMNHLNFQESDSTSEVESFERKVFRWFCDHQKICFLFDGFDEISPNYTSMATTLIQICRDNFAGKLWVTTRFGEFQKELEEILKVDAFTLKPLVRKEAENYILNFCTKILKNNTNERNTFDDYLNRVLSNLPQSTRHGEHDLISIPLQIKMIAELIEYNFQTYCNTHDGQFKLEKIDSVTLYEKFIDLKFNVWVKEKTTINTTILSNKQHINEHREKNKDNYRLAAICTLFNADETKIVLSKTELKAVHIFLHQMKNSVDRTGFIVLVADGKAKFVHQTLAEYFVAQFLWDKYSTLEGDELENFIHDIIIKCLILKDRTQIVFFLAEIASIKINECSDFCFKASILLKQLLKILPSSRREFERKAFSYALGIVENSIITDEIEIFDKFKKYNGTHILKHHRIILLKAAEFGYISLVSLITYNKPGCINDSINWLNGWTALHFAAHRGHIKIVKRLLNLSANVNSATEENGQTALHMASEMGYISIVQLLLYKGAQVNSASKHSGITPLHLAAQKGFAEIVSLLLTKGAAIDRATTVYGQTALHFASSKGYLETVRILTKHRGNVNIKTQKKSTPLHLATRNGHFDVARLLLEKGADPNNTTEKGQKSFIEKAFDFFKNNLGNVNEEIIEEGWTPLHSAAKNNDVKIAIMLLENGADIESTDALEELTPLLVATKEGHFEMVKTLVSKGANVNFVSSDKGWTALHWAAFENFKKIVGLLLKNGAIKSSTTTDGKTAQDVANTKKHTDIVHMLLAETSSFITFDLESESESLNLIQNCLPKLHPAVTKERIDVDFELKTEDLTPLMRACYLGNLKEVLVLLDEGANVRLGNTKKAFTPLHCAAQQNYPEIIRLLVANGADIDCVTSDEGRTPLFQASVNGAIDAVKILLEMGANVRLGRTDDASTPLHCAAKNNYPEIIRLLVEKGADIDCVTSDEGRTPLFEASLSGAIDAVKILLEMGANVHLGRTDTASTPLHCAAQNNYPEIIRLLVAKGADIDCVTSDEGVTPLFVASLSGAIAAVKILLEMGANVHLGRTDTASTPLHCAAQNNYPEIIRLLVAKGADIDCTTSDDGRTPLFVASLSGAIDAVKILLEMGANVLLGRTDTAYSPLHCAAQKNYPEIIRLLVAKGADIDCVTSDEGRTPLFEASLSGAIDAVKILLEMGANVHLGRTDTASTPLHCAAQNNYPEIIRLLVAKGADIDCTTSDDGRTPLFVASLSGAIDAVKILLEMGANVLLGRTDTAYSPLHCAAQKNYPEIIRLLVAKGADIDCVTSDEGRTPLFVASLSGAIAAVKILLEMGANVHLGRTDTASTPLHCAAQNNYPEIIRLLVAKGADIDCVTSDEGRTPLFVASLSGAIAAVKILLEMGANVHLGRTDTASTPLHCAAQNNYPEIIRLLVAKGADIDCTTSDDGRTPLFVASLSGAIDAVKILLEMGANVLLGRTDTAYSPLHCAAQKNYPEIIRLLVAKGADIDCVTSDEGRTPLFEASLSGAIDAVKILLEMGANVHLGRTDTASTPLHCAAQNNYPEIIRLLVAKGADIDCTTSDDGRTPLFVASLSGAIDAVKILLEMGANVLLGRTDTAYSPLHCAAQKNYPEIIRLLVAKGADIDCVTSDEGRTPLFEASLSGAIDAVKILLEMGANVHLGRTDTASTPLHCAAQNNYPEIIRLLVAKGADIDCTTSDDGRTPLFVASLSGAIAAVKILLEMGANVHLGRTDTASTPLHCAAQKNCPEIIRLLVAKGADIDCVTSDEGVTPLFVASWNGAIAAVKILLEMGANVHLGRTDTASTPLHCAAEKNCPEIIRLLVAKGADIDCTTSDDGRTPLHVAAWKGNSKAAMVLLEHGAS
ncbi:uncharacterized protein LOC120413312 isoform X2 [Culex pipiens pallens]|uniref:uncharacterized protein LOC120413312 isoform X2 n=1 Tax=Culex pipiens pallens TaxID=42434 RepID=UPI0022AB3326|nr:uncharacterized protein LOC120413312 isoform X2 [Culex pipiens pallens]